MEHWIAVDANSPAGAFFLSLQGKIGGATNAMKVGDITHPLIVGTDLNWSSPGFLRLTHVRNPGATDTFPREIALPSQTVLLVAGIDEPSAPQPPSEQLVPPTSLH